MGPPVPSSTVDNPASISSSGLLEAEVLIGSASRTLVPAPALPFPEECTAGRRPADPELTVEGAGSSPAESSGPVPCGASAISRRLPRLKPPIRPSSTPVGSLRPVAISGGASAVARRPPCLNPPPIRPSSNPRLASLIPNSANGSPSQAAVAGLPAPDSIPGSYISSPTGSSRESDSSTDSPHPTVFCGSDGSSMISNRSTTEAVPPCSSQSSFYTGTPPPRRVSSVIEGLNKYELYEAVRPETMREWEAAPGPKVIVFLANDSVTKEIHRRVTLIRNALITIFPDADPIVGSAEAVTAGLGSQPVLPFLVHRISEQYSHRLTTQCCWTINNFTFFAMHFALPTTSYAMTLTGLHLPKSQEGEDFVATLVRRWLSRSRSITSFIRKHYDNLPRFMSVEEQILSVIYSVEVAGMKLGDEDDSPVAFNVYINPPTNDPLRHQQWLKEVRAITYFAHCGTGKAVSVFHCNICKARDHSDDSCSFPGNQMIHNLDSAATQETALPLANSGIGNRKGSAERGWSISGINYVFIH